MFKISKTVGCFLAVCTIGFSAITMGVSEVKAVTDDNIIDIMYDTIDNAKETSIKLGELGTGLDVYFNGGNIAYNNSKDLATKYLYNMNAGDSATISVKKSTNIEFIGNFRDSVKLSDLYIVSGDPNVFTVNKYGVIKAVAPGVATLIVENLSTKESAYVMICVSGGNDKIKFNDASISNITCIPVSDFKNYFYEVKGKYEMEATYDNFALMRDLPEAGVYYKNVRQKLATYAKKITEKVAANGMCYNGKKMSFSALSDLSVKFYVRNNTLCYKVRAYGVDKRDKLNVYLNSVVVSVNTFDGFVESPEYKIATYTLNGANVSKAANETIYFSDWKFFSGKYPNGLRNSKLKLKLASGQVLDSSYYYYEFLSYDNKSSIAKFRIKPVSANLSGELGYIKGTQVINVKMNGVIDEAYLMMKETITKGMNPSKYVQVMVKIGNTNIALTNDNYEVCDCYTMAKGKNKGVAYVRGKGAFSGCQSIKFDVYEKELSFVWYKDSSDSNKALKAYWNRTIKKNEVYDFNINIPSYVLNKNYTCKASGGIKVVKLSNNKYRVQTIGKGIGYVTFYNASGKKIAQLKVTVV